MQIQYGRGWSEYGPGVDIQLTGDEVASAIYLYMAGQGVRVLGPRTVHGGPVRVYVDPSGSVTTKRHTYDGRGPDTDPFEPTYWEPK